MTNSMEIYHEKYANAMAKEGETLLLLDFSGSMYAQHSSGKTRFECLVSAVKRAGLATCPAVTFGEGGMRKLFSRLGDVLPRADGLNIAAEAQEMGTPMSEALGIALRRPRPKVAFLISDGEPTDGGWDSEQSAFEKALELGCPVNTIFIGSSPEGETLMGAIASATGGYYQNPKDSPIRGKDLTTQLTEAMEGVLPALPANV